MALSNAERQKRHRERQKARLRNGPMKSLPQILAEVNAKLIKEGSFDPEGVPLEAIVAEDVLGVFHEATISTPELSDNPEIAALFGGLDYIDAARKYEDEDRSWRRSRKKNKGDPPEPPPIPGVT